MKQKKKIAYLCSEYPAVSHTFILREIEELRKNDLQVFTISINPFRAWPKITAQETRESEMTFCIKEVPRLKIIFYYHLLTFFGAPLKYLKALFQSLKLAAFDGPKSPTKALGYFAEAAVLARWLKVNGLRHLHVHFLNPAATVVLIAAELYGFEFSFSVHGPDEFFDTEKNLLVKKIEKAKFVRCISYFCQSQLMRLSASEHWHKFRIVRCGVNLEDFAPAPEAKNKAPQMLCIGRLTKNKGQHILLQACAELMKTGKKFHLTLVGDGEDRGSLEDMVLEIGLKNHVTFTGSVGHEAIRKLYAQADLFVLPSFAEGVPIVLMEAMAIGVAVISTHIAGIPELIKEKKNGHLVFASDIQDLAEKIEAMLYDQTQRQLYRANARKTVEAKYNIITNGRQLAKIFNKELEN